MVMVVKSAVDLMLCSTDTFGTEVHSDLWVPLQSSVQSLGGGKYYITSINGFSHYTRPTFLYKRQ